uniref:ShTK domain protein n=1 Tax=Haemonchus contortus TaxID=6289 RepID=A0A7I5E878_HAECO
MIFSTALLVFGLIATVYSQSCSVATSGALNGLCPSGYTLITPTTCCPTASVVRSTTPSSSCIDKINPNTGKSDCTGMKSYCTNSAYLSLMRDQCPSTCGYCSRTVTVTSTPCVDKTNPRTGVNECPGMKAYCRQSDYLTLMKSECPKTCGYC